MSNHFAIEPLSHLPQRRMNQCGERTCLHIRDNQSGKWYPVTWQAFGEEVERIARAFVELGLGIQEPLGIFSENMKEFLVTDYAAHAVRAYTIPLYATSSTAQVRYIVEDARLRFIFVGDQLQYDTATPLRQELGIRIVTLSPHIVLKDDDTTTISFATLSEMGRKDDYAQEVERRREAAQETDTAFILYTSGTSGGKNASKGVILTHSNVLSAVRAHMDLPHLKAGRVSMNFLPLTHIFEKMWTIVCMQRNIEVAVNQHPKRILDSLQEIRPHYMCSVPRFWEKVYLGVREKLEQFPSPLRRLTNTYIEMSRRMLFDYKHHNKPIPTLMRIRYYIFSHTLLKALKKKLGMERGLLFPTAGAALADRIHAFLLSSGFPIVYGYGLTETTATVSYARHKDYEFGSIGKPLTILDVKIDEEAGGEILVKGPTVMKGYFNRPEEDARAFTADGYFRTGDLGHIDEKGNLFFHERAKDLYKTANGKYIAPQIIEGLLVSDIAIEQAMVVAEERSYVSALIYPNWPKVIQTMKQRGIEVHTDDITVLADEPHVHTIIREHVEALQSDLAEYEKVKHFIVMKEPFSVENGLLTNSLKTIRKAVLSRYEKEINDMYGYTSFD